ncbi:hypothetical protein HNY73_000660 [Argiope bruennichi]|uniref:BTB domain-containing protein n=1 Tax=Argiope bruennichi TaxID=94029 RepID=A0A8T0FYT0_ARGBR|nr:hypothetical protein HNY73_000660 [Argiope bruennichi]
MASFDSNTYEDIYEVKDVQIENFSSANRCNRVKFEVKRDVLSQLFFVTVYPKDVSSKYLRMHLTRIKNDPNSEMRKDFLSWTLSIVDVNGGGRYYQTFVKENFANIPYVIDVPDFLDLSVLQEQSEELLPGDVLTVRCELYCISTVIPSYISRNTHSMSTSFINNFGCFQTDVSDTKNLKSLWDEHWIKIDKSQPIEYDIARLFRLNLDMLMLILKCRKFNMDSDILKKHSEELSLLDAADEVRKTYMFSPLFKTYLRLKERLRKEINDPSPLSEDAKKKEERYLEELHSISLRMDIVLEISYGHAILNDDADFDQPLSQGISWSVEFRTPDEETQMPAKVSDECSSNAQDLKEKGERKVMPEAKPQTEEVEYLIMDDIFFPKDEMLKIFKPEYFRFRFKMDFGFFKHVIKYLFSDPDDENDGPVSQNQDKWTFFVETMDGMTFAIPFENGQETLGSRLINCSPVFESMLRNPMQEHYHKKVRFFDVDCQTFMNFLYHFQRTDLKVESLLHLRDLYVMADKFCVDRLMRICADGMRPYFNFQNIDDFEYLAHRLADKYLLELVNSYKAQNVETVVDVPYDKEKNIIDSDIPEKNETERDDHFDFMFS